MRRSISLALALTLTLFAPIRLTPSTAQERGLVFRIGVAEGLLSGPTDGRMFVVISESATPEPRLAVGNTGLRTPPVLGRDVTGFSARSMVEVGADAAIFPIARLADLPEGDYYVQAVFDHSLDLRLVNAPGNLYSVPVRASLNSSKAETLSLTLTESVPMEELPEDTGLLRFIKIESEVLSQFHGRPMYLRAGIMLPPDHDTQGETRYPLRVRIGGYGARFTEIRGLTARNSEFHNAWTSPDSPRMILLHLDGAGPLGDPYQVNSANHGPYGDAITRELIPHVERVFRGSGTRVLDGGSTGGWVSLALQIFYPDFFSGVWSYCPDSVDFRALQLIDIYQDRNAYVNRRGFERPSAREISGDVRFTMRHECQMENVLGRGDSWTMSGGQWGAWNATYGARGPDGRPVPLWDPRTGAIDSAAAEHWKKYDLRIVLEQNWKDLEPKLRGKINIWMGESDNYFLNNALYLFEGHLSKMDPSPDWRIIYGPREGHCWVGLTELEIMKEMGRVMEGVHR